MALLNLVYRDQLFPRRAYARAFEVLLSRDLMFMPRICTRRVLLPLSSCAFHDVI